MPKDLMMDGLDQLRDRLDTMSVVLPGWQFQMVSASPPHAYSSVQVEAHCPEIKKQAGLVLREEDILSGEWKDMLQKMETALSRATYGND